jgi:hypothetical protein
MTIYKAISGQSIIDVCLNTYGSIDYLYKLMQDNNVASVNTNVYGGQKFTWDDSLVIDQGLNTAFKSTNTRYCTDISNNGSVFYVIEGNGNGTGNGNGDPYNPGQKKYQMVFSTFYEAASDGETVITVRDASANLISGYDIVQIEKNIKPLKPSEFSWNKNASVLTLIDNSLGIGEQLFILFSKIIIE